ncbi:MAG: hypothetical protein ACTHZ9_13255 [Leucobacter sp.]
MESQSGFLERPERLNPELSTVTTASWLDLFHHGVLSDGIDVLMPSSPSTSPGYPAADEDWLIMVASDHGFIGHGHGAVTLDEHRVFVYATGPGAVDLPQ